MMKKLFSLILILFLLSSLTLTAAAQTNPYIADEAGLLDSGEITDLEVLAASLSDSYGIDIVILTVDSLGGAYAQDYADAYYDSNGYGDDGILFLLSMAEREWYISTCGSMIYALTDYSIQQLGEGMLHYLSSGYWYEGFRFFLESLPYYLDAYAAGKPVDGYADYSGDYYHGTQEEVVYYTQERQPNFLLSMMAGLAAGGITILIMRSTMNTKRSQRGASVYLKEGSWTLDTFRDLYLYSNVTKTRRQQNTSGGGSSVHRSSGGRSHGGGGGRF